MAAAASALVAATIAEHRVVVFSKTFCPYCDKAKAAFAAVSCTPFVMELDARPDGGAIQAALATLTGGSSVPRVFIAGKFIGGGDDTAAAQRSGQLALLCRAAGAIQ